MKKQTILTLSAALLLGLVSCNEQSSVSSIVTSSSSEESIVVSSSETSSQEATSQSSKEESSSQEISSSEQTSESTPASSSEASSSEVSSSSSEATKYAISIQESTNVTIVADKTTAAKSETVTLTATVPNGYTIKSITVTPNVKSVTTVEANKTYTFVMPNNPVDVEFTVDVVQQAGQVSIIGDAAVILEEQPNGIWVARGVKYPSNKLTCEATYVVDGQNLSCTLIDNYKCFATLGVSGSKNVGFTIAGNATYDFFYDPSAKFPCYVVRTEIGDAPTSAKTFQDLWGHEGGSVKSESTTYPQNVKKVNYTNTKSGDIYQFENYENGSYAVSEITVGEGEEAETTTSYVYKNIDNNVYSVVDTYIEGSAGTGDTTYRKRDDNKAFSGKYSVVDSIASGFSAYQYTKEDAEFDAHLYSHDMTSLDEDMMYGYRVGFDSSWDETLVGYDIQINSVKNENGFTTTIESYKNYDDSKDSSTTSNAKYHYQYKIVASFDKAGKPLSGTYIEKSYTSAQYNVDTSSFIGSNSFETGTLVKKTTWSYEYGDPTTGSADFDTTGYFATSVSATINNPNMAASGNKIAPNDCLNDYCIVTTSPATALDGWQYGIVSSSNPSIVSNTKMYPNKFVAKGAGNVSIKIGNHTTNDVTYDVDVESINNYTVYSFTLTTPPESKLYYDDEIFKSDGLYVRSNCAKTVQIIANSRKLKSDDNWMSLKTGVLAENTRVAKVTSDSKGKTVVDDAIEVNLQNGVWSTHQVTQPGALVTVATFKSIKSVSAQTTYYVWLTCDNIDTYNIEKEMLAIEVRVVPYEKPTKGLYGTWSDAADVAAGEEVTAVVQEYDESVGASTYSTISLDGATYNFKFNYDDESGLIIVSPVGSLGYIAVVYDSTYDELGFFLAAGASWGGEDEGTDDSAILGEGYSDYEGGFDIETYYFLSRVTK